MKRFALLAVFVFFATVICMGKYLSASSAGHDLYSESRNHAPDESSGCYEVTNHTGSDEDGLHHSFSPEMHVYFISAEHVLPFIQFLPDCLPASVWQPPKTI
jgi:hypothetical protein